MHIQFLMNSEHLFLYLFICIGLVQRLSTGCLRDDIVEHFYYTSDSIAEQTMHHESDVQIEFTIIGRKVSWMEAKMLCPSYDDQPSAASSSEAESMHATSTKMKFLTRGSSKLLASNTLAIFTDEEEANWLARMLSESNYRYEGLWIGGTRKNKSSAWDWISDTKLKNSRVPRNILFESYPSWYHMPNEVSSQQNCLLFNRIGHDIPVFIPENCQLRRPFICMQDVKKKLADRISEGASISVDGYRYTLYNVNDDNDVHYVHSGTQRLNGGGITWKDARNECIKRGKQLAMVMTNEAATAIADMMLKNRPSMENVWLGGWSLDGSEWIWVPTGANLPLVKSRSTQYPPWLEGHPIIISKNDYYYQRTSRCLILDRHLCPEQIAPVFLDLDCDKERPFICQDAKIPECSTCETIFGEGRNGLIPRNLARRITIENEEFEFSEEQMTYEDAEDYCINRDGQVANVLNSKILSASLEMMSELAINHVWVGGRTVKISGEWHWIDSNGKTLSSNGVGTENDWCFGEQNQLPKAEPNYCLNLDYETRGYPLFYGLPCNSSQQVLCSAPFNASEEQVVEVHSDEVDTRIIGDMNVPISKYANKALITLKDITVQGSNEISKVLSNRNNRRSKGKSPESKPTDASKKQSPSNTTSENSSTTASDQNNTPTTASTGATADGGTQTKADDTTPTPTTNSATESTKASDSAATSSNAATTQKANDPATQAPTEATAPK